ncbi:hypothetical protein BH11BAC2_BH11BAC2_21080 [soil metagenome]
MKALRIVIALLIFPVIFASAQQTRLSYRLACLLERESDPLKPINVLVKGDVNYLKEEVSRMGGIFKYAAGNIASVKLTVQAIRTLSVDPRIIRIEEGSVKLQQLNDKMLINNRINLVQQGISPLTQGYDGENVVFGIIDTGLDFSHPDFQDTTGKTRVLWIWDHLLADSTNTPLPYGYGQEFSKNDIDSGRASAHIDQTAHGTHVAGIGSSNGQTGIAYKGAAPKADIIAVSVNFNVADDAFLSSVADAVAYIFHKADSLGKPCVINISAGSYIGSHDGKDLQAGMIDNLITGQNGHAVVAAAGNLGGYPLHLQHNPIVGDTSFTWFKTTGNAPVYIEFWADTANLNQVQFTIGADQTTPTYDNRGSLPWTNINAHLSGLVQDTLYSTTGNQLAIIQTYGQLIGDRYSMIYYIEPDSGTYSWRLSSTGSGSFDCWSFDYVFTGLPTPGSFPPILNYKMPDIAQNICSSFQCSDKVITSGQYVNRNNYVDVNGNVQTFPTTVGAKASSSSIGPTRDGRIKPDITSTGEVTMSALRVSSQAWFLANQPFKLSADGQHIRDGGTSSAAPAIAGAIALYFQKDPTASWDYIKSRITQCALHDNFTGNNLPNSNWGYGKLDAMALMIGCNILGLVPESNNSVSLAPNPSANQTFLTFPSVHASGKITILNLIGEVIQEINVAAKDNEVVINQNNISNGIYILKIQLGNNITTEKLVWE